MLGRQVWSMILRKKTGLNLREPNFPDKMMDYQDVVKFLEGNRKK